jgi:hypothetical protein
MRGTCSGVTTCLSVAEGKVNETEKLTLRFPNWVNCFPHSSSSQEKGLTC